MPDIWTCLPQWISFIKTKFKFLQPPLLKETKEKGIVGKNSHQTSV